jgi:hypothetical protein
MRGVVFLSLALVVQIVGGSSTATQLRSRAAPRSTDFLPPHNFKPDQVLPTLLKYHDAVVEYRQGHTRDAMSAVSSLPRAQVEFIMEALRSERRGKPVRRPPPDLTEPLPVWMRAADEAFRWPRADLQAAGLLHGDITLSKVDKEDFEDELRLTLSMLPIADLPQFNSDERPETWTRDWLRAVGGTMLAAKAWGPLRVLLAYADLFFPDDGPLLLTRGTLDELQSESAAPPIALTYAEGPARTRRDRDVLRDEAIESLTRALKLMPESDEAAVRLAHVRLDIHQPARAAPLLDRVLASGHGDWWYFAALMRGDAYAIGGDPPAAERLYRMVIDHFPLAQAPYVALAALQYSNGRHKDAAATIDLMYARAGASSPSDEDDYWWKYGENMGPAANAALDQLRAAVRQ